jgi:hypothetical protein
MESINHPPLRTRILLALMQQIPMNQHQRPSLDLPKIINLLLHFLVLLQPLRPLLPLIRGKRRPFPILRPHEPVPNRRALVGSRRERQTPVLRRSVLERVPEAYSRGRVRVQEDGVLVRRHAAADLGLLADDHGLQDAWVAEAQGARDGGVLGVDGGFGEGGVEMV